MSNVTVCKIDDQGEQETILLKALFGEDHSLTWASQSYSDLRTSSQAAKFLTLLEKEWGNYNVYSIYHNDKAVGVFALYAISSVNRRADLFCWLHKNERHSLVLPHAAVLFIEMCRTAGIDRLFAKIKGNNVVAISAAKKYGFTECGRLPNYFMDSKSFQDALIITRTCELTASEIKLAREMKLISAFA